MCIIFYTWTLVSSDDLYCCVLQYEYKGGDSGGVKKSKKKKREKDSDNEDDNADGDTIEKEDANSMEDDR